MDRDTAIRTLNQAYRTALAELLAAEREKPRNRREIDFALGTKTGVERAILAILPLYDDPDDFHRAATRLN